MMSRPNARPFRRLPSWYSWLMEEGKPWWRDVRGSPPSVRRAMDAFDKRPWILGFALAAVTGVSLLLSIGGGTVFWVLLVCFIAVLIAAVAGALNSRRRHPRP